MSTARFFVGPESGRPDPNSMGERPLSRTLFGRHDGSSGVPPLSAKAPESPPVPNSLPSYERERLRIPLQGSYTCVRVAIRYRTMSRFPTNIPRGYVMRRMMMLAAAVALLIVAAGCGGEFAQEKTVLKTLTSAMEKLNERSPTPTSRGTGQGPRRLLRRHGEGRSQDEGIRRSSSRVGQGTPEAMKDVMDKFEEAQEGFMSKSMPKIMQSASEHSDNEALQKALEKMMNIGDLM